MKLKMALSKQINSKTLLSTSVHILRIKSLETKKVPEEKITLQTRRFNDRTNIND